MLHNVCGYEILDDHAEHYSDEQELPILPARPSGRRLDEVELSL